MDYDSFRKRLIATIPTLSRRVEDGARYILDHPDDVVALSMRELSKLARVSPATLTRLTEAVGLSGWAELKALHMDHFRRVPPAYAERAASLISRDDQAGLIDACFSAARLNLEHTQGANAAAEFATAAEILTSAKRVCVSAFLSCRGPGHTFAYIARMLRENVVMLGEGSSLVADMQSLGPEDAVISINFRPYGREMNQVAEAVRQSGARLVCLTDSRATPLTPLAQSVLIFSPDSPSFFPSLTAATAAVEALLAAMLAEMGETARQRIGEIERRLYASGTYAATNDNDWDFDRGPARRPRK